MYRRPASFDEDGTVCMIRMVVEVVYDPDTNQVMVRKIGKLDLTADTWQTLSADSDGATWQSFGQRLVDNVNRYGKTVS